MPNIVPKLKKRKLVAFCGIGRPEKFFTMLRELNLEIIEEFSFPDHHFYSKRQLTKILNVAEKNNALDAQKMLSVGIKYTLKKY